MPLEVKVKEFILQPLRKAGEHLSFQLLHILISRSDEVPLQNLPNKRNGIHGRFTLKQSFQKNICIQRSILSLSQKWLLLRQKTHWKITTLQPRFLLMYDRKISKIYSMRPTNANVAREYMSIPLLWANIKAKIYFGCSEYFCPDIQTFFFSVYWVELNFKPDMVTT